MSVTLYLKPSITGYVIFDQNVSYINISSSLNQSSYIPFNVDKEISSLYVNGAIKGNGSAIIYFENLTVASLNSSCSCQETELDKIKVLYNGITNSSVVSIYNKHGNEFEFKENASLFNNTFSTDKIGKPETMFAIDNDSAVFHISDINSRCNIINGSFEILDCEKECDSDTIICNETNFDFTCIDTCSLPNDYNKNNYTLTVDIENVDIFLSSIAYSYYNTVDNSSTNETQQNNTSPIIQQPSASSGGGSSRGGTIDISANQQKEDIAVAAIQLKPKEEMPQEQPLIELVEENSNLVTGQVIFGNIFGQIKYNLTILIILILIMIYQNRGKIKSFKIKFS